MPEPVFSVWGSSNPNYDSQNIDMAIHLSPPLHPIMNMKFASNESTLLKEVEVFGYNRSDYTSERIWQLLTMEHRYQCPSYTKKILDRTKAQRLLFIRLWIIWG